MIAQAQEKSRGDATLEFRQASAEHLPFLADASVDCVIAAQAAHWFDYAKLWPELGRVLRRDGTVAFFGYRDFVFVDYPQASEIMQQYSYDLHPDKLGSYWQQPGRSYVQDKLRVVRPPEEAFGQLERVEYEPGVAGRRSGQGTLFMEKRLSVGACKEYLRTWSAYHGWREAHPGEEARSQGGPGDVADQIFDEIARATEDFRDERHEVDVEWGSGLVMARRS
jgi:SAM-dependent methyltransferase